MNECSFKGSSMGLKAPQTVKWLAAFQGTGESQLLGPLEPGESQLPGVQSTYQGVVLLFVWQKFCADLNLWAINLQFSRILETYETYNLWKFQIDRFKIYPCRPMSRSR